MLRSIVASSLKFRYLVVAIAAVMMVLNFVMDVISFGQNGCRSAMIQL